MKPSTICPTCGRLVEQQRTGRPRDRHPECSEFETRKAQLAEAAGQIVWGSKHHLRRERGNLVSIVNQNLHWSKGQNLPEVPTVATTDNNTQGAGFPQQTGSQDEASSNPDTWPQTLKLAA